MVLKWSSNCLGNGLILGLSSSSGLGAIFECLGSGPPVLLLEVVLGVVFGSGPQMVLEWFADGPRGSLGVVLPWF